MSTHGDVEKIPWFHFKYGTIFLIRFEGRTQKQHKNHYIIRITRVITHETSSCVQHVFNSNPPRTRYHSPDNFIDFHGLMWL